MPSDDGRELIPERHQIPPLTIYEAGFKLQHECAFNDLSKRYPSLAMSHWCNSGVDVLEIACDDLEVFESLQKDIGSLEKALGTKVLRKSFSMPHVQLVIQRCGCSNIKAPVSPVFEKNNCLELQPCLYKGGWEYYRVIAFNDRDLKNLFTDLGKYCSVEVLSRRSTPTGAVKDVVLVSTKSLFGGLTAKQMQALVFALENGYYQVPKKVTTEEMARRLSQPRTTYEEHLRKAESKVLRSVTPYINFKPR